MKALAHRKAIEHNVNSTRMQHPLPNNPPIGKKPINKKPINAHPVHNRVRSFMEHTTRYAFMGEVRLAEDCRVSCATISRLLSGKSSPSYALSVRIAQAFEKQFEKPIDLREIISLDGSYPSETVCVVVGCKGCSPQAAWNEDDTIKDDYLTKSSSPSTAPVVLMSKEVR